METTLQTTQKWGVLLAVGIGTFMTALDTSVVNTVLPVIGKNFSKDISVTQWVVTIYLLVLSGLLLSFGRLGDMRGHKIIYLIGFGIFMGGSFFSGSSTECGNTDCVAWVAGIGGSDAGSQFSSDFNQKLSSRAAGTGVGAASNHDLPGAGSRTVGGWMVSQPARVAGSLLYEFTGWNGCHLAQLALYSRGSKPHSARNSSISWER